MDKDELEGGKGVSLLGDHTVPYLGPDPDKRAILEAEWLEESRKMYEYEMYGGCPHCESKKPLYRSLEYIHGKWIHYDQGNEPIAECVNVKQHTWVPRNSEQYRLFLEAQFRPEELEFWQNEWL